MGLKSEEDASTFDIQKIFCHGPSLLGCPTGYHGIDCVELPQSPALATLLKVQVNQGNFFQSHSAQKPPSRRPSKAV